MEEPRWTLDELAERVDAALAVGYAGQSSGRVRAVPDRRAIRWYTTIGLIDRPVAHRGRTALYGPRHLLQLVAVKRLQAKGLPLVAIQQELAGATDTQLARVAHPAPASAAPLAALAAGGGGPQSSPDALAAQVTAARRPGVGGRARRGGFWREQPAAFAAAPVPVAPSVAGPAAVVATLRGVDLGEGTTLLLEPGRELAAADLHAILDAARPLLAVLRERGLDQAAGGPGPGAGPRPEGPPELRREHP
ncbi:MAG TPA: MerR family transcriptional regulator [Actinomycetes bacterium]|nr:MerR family transcriptional regulator [Actinomycetes bacterium]